MAMEEGVPWVVRHEGLVDALPRQAHGHGQKAPGQSLGEGHKIRLDAGPPAGKQRSRAPETRHHLIGNQQGACRPDPLGHPLEETWTHHGHAPGPLHQRFNDHRCGGGLQKLVQVLQCGLLSFLHGVVPPPCGWTPAAGHGKEQRLEGDGKQGAGPQRHGTEGVAVIGAVKGDQLLTRLPPVVPILQRHLEAYFHRRGAVIREKQPIQTRPGSAEPLGQSDRRIMAEIGKDHLLQLPGLLGNGRGNGGLPMSMQGHPPTADGIQHPATVRQLQPGAVTGAHHPGRIMAGLLGKGVPEMGMPTAVGNLLGFPGRASHGARRSEMHLNLAPVLDEVRRGL